MRSTMAHRGLALLAAMVFSATLLLTTSVAIVSADSPLPSSITASVNGMTATVSGSWWWDGRKPGCDDKYAGWQVHWNDPAAPGNPVANGVAVGTPTENTVQTNLVCAPSGTTSPMTHTYAAPGTYNVCIVMYDVHRGDVGKSGGHGTVAGGPDRNKDNSIEDGKLGLTGPGCTSVTILAPAKLVVGKTVNRTSASPGDTLTWTITVRNTGGTGATGVDVSDDLAAALARGSFQGASNGGSLNGSTVRWSNLAVAPGEVITMTASVRLAATGWPSGTTAIPNTVVVPTSNCAAGSGNGECTTSTTVSAAANLGVRLTVDRESASPGDTLAYTIRIENSGSANATGVSVTDNISGLLARGSFVSATNGGSLVGSTVTWSGLSVSSGAVLTLGFSVRLNSTGWASGTTNLSTTVVVPGSDCASGSANGACRALTVVTTAPRLAVRTSVAPATADPGETVTYSITIENSGTAAATSLTVTDDLTDLLARTSFQSASNGGSLSGNTLRWTSLNVPAGASVTLTYSVKLDLAGWTTGTTTIRNAVTVPGTDCTGAAISPCTANLSVTPRFALTVTKGVGTAQAGPFGSNLAATAGDTVWYSIRVTNTGNATLSGLTVSDSMGLPSGQCSAVPGTLAPGASWTCTYFRSATEGTSTNTVTANSSQTQASSASATVTAGPPPAPAIRVTKTASTNSLPVGGGSVTYTYVVSNPGNVALSGVSVSDDRCSPVILGSGDGDGNNRLDTNETWRYTCSTNLTATTTNTATARGSFNGTQVTATDKATVTVTVAAPSINVATSASPNSLGVGGGRVTYTYLVGNTGNAPLSNVSVSDTRCADVRYASGDTNGNDRLDLAETWRFTCSTTVDASVRNNATARGTFNGATVTATDGASVTVTRDQAGIHIVKAANPTSLPAGGGEVTYTYVVTNAGNTELSDVSVSDDRCSPVRYISGDSDRDNRLDVSETWQFRCVTTVTATTTNTATVTATSGATRVSATDRATVAVTSASAAINVAVTASPATLAAGGGNVTYGFVVTNKGNVPLESVSLVNDGCDAVRATGGDTNGDRRLDLSEAWTYACTIRVTTTTTNTVLATAFSNGRPVTDTDQALVTVGEQTTRTPRIGLTKTANPVALPAGGGALIYGFEVTNKGDAPLSSISIDDDSCSPVVYRSGDADGDRVLDVGETWLFTCGRVVTETTSNTAIARGTYEGATVTASDEVTVTVAPTTPAPGGPTPSPGDGSGTATESPTPTDGGQPSPSDPSGAPSPTDGSQPTPSDGTGSGNTGGSPGSGGTGGGPTVGTGGALPTGSVQGNAGAGGGTSPVPGDGYVINFQQSTPSGIVMILILLLGVAASVVIMTLSKRTSIPT